MHGCIITVVQLPETLEQAHARITHLEQQLAWYQNQFHGRSSEKQPRDISPDQARLFNEPEDGAVEEVKPPAIIQQHQRGKPGAKAISKDIPRIVISHDIPDAEKVCPHDGTALERMEPESSEQLDIVPGKVRVLVHQRHKYVCPCCRTGVKIAPVPPHILPKSKASASLLAHVVTAKYVDAMPLYRQEAQLERMGVQLPRSTMATWMVKLGTEAVVPIINLLHEQQMAEPLLLMDETPTQVVMSEKSTHYIWVRAAGPPGRRSILFDHDPSRSGAVPRRLLEGYKGILVTDGYEAYNAVAAQYGLIHAGCWTHARRGFDAARKLLPDPQSRSRAGIALDLIGKLYLIERELKEATNDERLAARKTRSAVIVQELRTWLDSMLEAVLPQSPLGKAVRYTLEQWNKLTVFLDHGEVPLDTNRVENAIRPFVIGRKNWLFSHTANGATASANLYSLVETAKANGLEPHAYLSHLFAELPKAATLADFEALLPWNARSSLNR